MPYTGHPDTVPADEVRFLLGDTDADHPKLTDQEIRYLLARNDDNVLRAAYQGAGRLVAQFSSKGSKTVGPTSLNYGEQASYYRTLQADLGKLGGRPPVGPPVAGGLDSPMPISDAEWEGNLQ